MIYQQNKQSFTSLFQLSFLAFAALLFTGCQEGFGEKIVVDGTEIYYDGTDVTKADAERLGASLKETEFTDGNLKSVQLQKDGEEWIFRMVVQEDFLKGNEMDKDFEFMCLQLSGDFDGAAFKMHACDEQLKTKKEFSGKSGKKVSVGKSELYYSDLTDEQFTKVEAALRTLGFDSFESTLRFSKGSDAHEFFMVCKPGFYENEELTQEAKAWIPALSKAIAGEKVIVHFCNDYLEPQNTIK